MTGAPVHTGQLRARSSGASDRTPDREAAMGRSMVDSRPDGDRSVSWTVGTILVLATSTGAVAVAPALRHWFLIPVTMCGILIVPDAVDWGRRRLDTFDPQAMLGLIGIHFFYVSPVLHVLLDHWVKYVDGPADWRNALGQMALLNVLGLMIYRAAMAPGITPSRVPLPETDVARFCRLAAAFAVLGALCLAALVVSMGGPASYATIMANDRQQLVGLGPALLVSEIFPTAVLVLVLVRYRRLLRGRPIILFLLVVPTYVLMQMLIGGLGGSRSHTVWSVVIAVGLSHFLVKPVRRRTLGVLAIALIAFMYLYGLYKDVGTKAFQSISDGSTLSQLSSETGRDLPSVLLQDFGRADIQALVLERQREGTAPLQYGLTYIGDLAFLVPGHAVLGHAPDKVQAGTDMLYGEDAYSWNFRASQVYGLAGEAVLNFGPAGAVLAFLPLAMVMRASVAFYRRCLAAPDAPGLKILAPSISLGAAFFVMRDMDSTAWYILHYLAFLAVLAYASRAGWRLWGTGGGPSRRGLTAHSSSAHSAPTSRSAARGWSTDHAQREA